MYSKIFTHQAKFIKHLLNNPCYLSIYFPTFQATLQSVPGFPQQTAPLGHSSLVRGCTSAPCAQDRFHKWLWVSYLMDKSEIAGFYMFSQHHLDCYRRWMLNARPLQFQLVGIDWRITIWIIILSFRSKSTVKPHSWWDNPQQLRNFPAFHDFKFRVWSCSSEKNSRSPRTFPFQKLQ